METNILLFAAYVILGTVTLAAVAGQAYAKRKGDETIVAALQPFQQTANGVLRIADRSLAPYGSALAPLHGAATLVEGLIDEPTDPAVQLLPPHVVEALRIVADYTQRLTDGVVEAHPLGEPPREFASSDDEVIRVGAPKDGADHASD